MGAIELRYVAQGDPLYELASVLRREVLYEPFGLELEVQGSDDLDPRTLNLVAVEAGRLVGFGRLVRRDGEPPRIRQMAVVPDRQGSGVGSLIVEELVARAGAEGEELVWLEARVPAVTFYERLGFRTAGEVFIHRNLLPHVRMERETGTAG